MSHMPPHATPSYTPPVYRPAPTALVAGNMMSGNVGPSIGTLGPSITRAPAVSEAMARAASSPLLTQTSLSATRPSSSISNLAIPRPADRPAPTASSPLPIPPPSAQLIAQQRSTGNNTSTSHSPRPTTPALATVEGGVRPPSTQPTQAAGVDNAMSGDTPALARLRHLPLSDSYAPSYSLSSPSMSDQPPPSAAIPPSTGQSYYPSQPTGHKSSPFIGPRLFPSYSESTIVRSDTPFASTSSLPTCLNSFPAPPLATTTLDSINHIDLDFTSHNPSPHFASMSSTQAQAQPPFPGSNQGSPSHATPLPSDEANDGRLHVPHYGKNWLPGLLTAWWYADPDNNLPIPLREWDVESRHASRDKWKKAEWIARGWHVIQGHPLTEHPEDQLQMIDLENLDAHVTAWKERWGEKQNTSLAVIRQHVREDPAYASWAPVKFEEAKKRKSEAEAEAAAAAARGEVPEREYTFIEYDPMKRLKGSDGEKEEDERELLNPLLCLEDFTDRTLMLA